MERSFLKIDKEKCNEIALKLFCETSGLNQHGEKFERMRKDASVLIKKLQTCVSPRCEYIYFDKSNMDLIGRTLTVSDRNFVCNAFEQINPSSIEGVFLYACCAGDYLAASDDILDQVYADLWGTAYIDAIRQLAYEYLCELGLISESFGPGFYGMELSEIRELKALLDFDELGIKVEDSGAMVPQKSCTGIYFKVNEKYERLRKQCETCKGNQSSCKLCNIPQN